ncbi:MAG: peptide chain release factor N(5)-glutamine methyltransferase [Gammaproteobacteria bacterium]|jgi:release factor glutamine methyltransferase
MTAHAERPNLAALRKAGRDALAAGDSARLDCELLLAHVIGKDRTTLYREPERVVSDAEQAAFERLIAERVGGRPIAQILGRAEFWSLSFEVDDHVLIPRPETERLVELALERADHDAVLVDLGCGSGAIAVALATELPQATITATDFSAAALAVACRNAQRLCANRVRFIRADWLAPFGESWIDILVSNPPYVAADDPRLDDTDIRFEPRAALASGADGLAAIRQIVAAAARVLRPGGWLLLEHGYNQGPAVRELFHRGHLNDIATTVDLGGTDRITSGRR